MHCGEIVPLVGSSVDSIDAGMAPEYKFLHRVPVMHAVGPTAIIRQAVTDIGIQLRFCKPGFRRPSSSVMSALKTVRSLV